VQMDVDDANRSRIGTRFTDPEKYDRREGDPKASPALVMQKIPENADPAVTPIAASIILAKMPSPGDELALKDVAEMIAGATTEALEDVVMETPVHEIKLGGIAAYTYQYRYTAVSDGDKRFAMRTAMVIARKDSEFCLIGYGGPSEGPENGVAALDEMIKSFQFVEATAPKQP